MNKKDLYCILLAELGTIVLTGLMFLEVAFNKSYFDHFISFSFILCSSLILLVRLKK